MKHIKRHVSILLSLLMIVSLFTIVPFTSHASTSISYVDRKWNSKTETVTEETKTREDCTELSERSSDTLEMGWYAVTSDTIVNDRLYVNFGTVNLIIKDGVTLTLKEGFEVAYDRALVIYGQEEDSGIINASITDADKSYSAIGGSSDAFGDVYICGGKVNATAYKGACIGGINHTGGGYESEINIYGGEVSAESTEGGAGIGGSKNYANCQINIHGGMVTAFSSNEDTAGAGIGGGANSGSCGYTCRSINIHKGTVFGMSSSGAGIGGGKGSSSGAINISGGSVLASSIDGGAGIGGGFNGSASDKISIKNADVVTSGLDPSRYGKFSTFEKMFFKAIGDNIDISKMNFNDGFFSLIGGAFENLVDFIGGLINSDEHGYGAGIGGGANGASGEIEIYGSTVVARGGTESAGIGCGKSHKYNYITVEWSNVDAKGGTDAAGIGGGLYAGSIYGVYLEKSTVKAVGGSEGAGIGTGNEPTTTSSVTIMDCDITAVGGYKGAGIGGDEGNAKTITIENSTVDAWGGEDAAGIGGGETGDGGDITIENSDVTAYTDLARLNSKYSGNASGIGCGEDGGYTKVTIKGADTRVEAFGGYDGDAAAIGRGNNGIFYPYDGEDAVIDSYMKVKAGSTKNSATYRYGSDRNKAVGNNKYALITGCEHTDFMWVYESAGKHKKYCRDCGTYLYDEETHKFGDDFVCTKCGFKTDPIKMTFVEQDTDGSTVKTEVWAAPNCEFPVITCTHAPEGQEFVWWEDDWTKVYDNGDIATTHTNEMTFTAHYMPVQNVNYIDEFNVERTVKARKITSADSVCLTEGWYYVDGSVDITSGVLIRNNVNLIIADSAQFNVDSGYTAVSAVNVMKDVYYTAEASLTLYGQQEQTGKFKIADNCRVDCTNFTQYGSQLKMSGGTYGRLDVKDTLTLGRNSFSNDNIDCKKLVYHGGTVNLSSLGDVETVELGWSGKSDRITFNNSAQYADSVEFTVAENQAFEDNDGNRYEGTLTSAQITQMNGKTLHPYAPHNFAEPSWEWFDDYSEATATFTCQDEDCDVVMTADAEVTRIVSGNNITAEQLR